MNRSELRAAMRKIKGSRGNMVFPNRAGIISVDGKPFAIARNIEIHPREDPDAQK